MTILTAIKLIILVLIVLTVLIINIAVVKFTFLFLIHQDSR